MKRVILKLSGETLGLDGRLFDHGMFARVASVLVRAAKEGAELGVVIGAGNIWRGRVGLAGGMDAVTADQMGMLGTVINCLCMRDAIERTGGRAEVFSAVEMPRVCPVYTARAADAWMKSGGVALFGGGTGNPFFSTDTGVALRAAELRADALLMAKNVNGVYTADPNKDASAVFLPRLTYAEAVERNLQVMDGAALLMCRDRGIPCRVFALSDPENILRAIRGEDFGSVITP